MISLVFDSLFVLGCSPLGREVDRFLFSFIGYYKALICCFFIIFSYRVMRKKKGKGY